ncbi:FluG domain-containing protein [Podospora fimiseda]|uniref:FluG domain-containing protein n=1 Tax=Podospora fimiseda TaxID=252190 RepID=A0AAN7H0V9_9PEZI|nr:FluG domain-containing protein [Podospora fimiseda]
MIRHDPKWATLPPDPEIETVEAEKAQLKGGQYRIKGSEHEDRIRELARLIAAKAVRRKNDIRRAYREDYFYNRPTRDIEANGQEEREYVELAIDLYIPERKRETVKRNRIQRRARADVKQCPHCIGDETMSFETKTFKYCRPAVMYDHFDRKHTQQLGSKSEPDCRGSTQSRVLNHFKNHVEKVHGVN